MNKLNLSTYGAMTKEQIETLSRIQRNIKRSHNQYALYFVECNLPNLRRQLIDELNNTDELHLLTLDIADYPEENSLHIDEWVNKQKIQFQSEYPKLALSGINILGLERLLPTDSDEKVIKTVSELNWRRSYFKALSVPVIFWLPSYVLSLLANQASDFYDWYSDIYHFNSGDEQKKEAYSQQVKSLRHPKSDISAHLYQSKQEKNKQLRQLISLLDESNTLNDKAYIRNQVGLLFYSMGELEKSLFNFQQSHDLYKEVDKGFDVAVVLNNISQVLITQGYNEKALKYLERALSILENNNERQSSGATLNNIGQAYSLLGNYNDALVNYKIALKISKEFNDKSGISSALNNIASVFHVRGDYANALRYFNKSLVVCKETGDKAGISKILNNTASIYEINKDYESAKFYFEQSLEICNAIGDKLGIATTLSNIANIFKEQGNYSLALDYLEKALDIDRETKNKFGISNSFNNLAQIYMAKGDYGTAINYLKKAIKVCEEVDNKEGLAYSYYNLGALLEVTKSDLVAKNNPYLQKSYELAKEIGLEDILSSFQASHS